MWTVELGRASSARKTTGTGSSGSAVCLPLLTVFAGGYFMPPYRHTTMRFIKDFLGGRKELLKAADVVTVNVPTYPELAVKEVVKQVAEDPEVMKYLPVYQETKEPPERTYFYAILATLRLDYL